MRIKYDKVFSKRSKLGVALICGMSLFLIGFFVYLGSGASMSISHFDLQYRDDTKWGFQKAEIAELSWAGATVRTGRSYALGPFRLSDWKEPAASPARLTETKALVAASSAVEKAGNHLDDYKPPRIIFHNKGRQWTIFWERKAPIAREGHLMVVVDDTTGEAQVTPSQL